MQTPPMQARCWANILATERKAFASLCTALQGQVAAGTEWESLLALANRTLVTPALSNALAGRFFDVCVSSRESSKLKIHAPTQCFIRVGRSHESGRMSGDEARKSMLFGLQNRRRGRPGDPKSSASALGRAKKRSMSARSIAIFFNIGCKRGQSERASARRRRSKSAQAPNTPRARYVQIDKDMSYMYMYMYVFICLRA